MVDEVHTQRLSLALRWIGGIGIVVFAFVRCVQTIVPHVVFDINPVLSPDPLPGIGPVGSLIFDSLVLVACALGMLGIVLGKKSINWWLVLLAMVPIPVIIYHGLDDIGNMWRGTTWAASAISCVVLAHLARDRTLRIALFAVLFAVFLPLVVRGAMQSKVTIFGATIEGSLYAQQIEEVETYIDEFIEDLGWEKGSASALIFERRARQANPRGWFPTTNIFASLIACGLIISVGLGIGAVRSKQTSGWIGFCAILAAIMVLALLLSGSKGAIFASLAGLALLVVPRIALLKKIFTPKRAGALIIAMIGLALLAVVVRGTVLNEGFLGEKSLLFRWHYMAGASKTISENPVLGVGPDEFKTAYTLNRLARSPEEVTSVHSAFVDWISMLGMSGIAWVLLVLLLLYRAGSQIDNCDDDWLSASLPWSLTAAASALFIHAQIEMTLFDPGSSMWIFCILGIASPSPPLAASRDRQNTKYGIAIAVTLITATIILTISTTTPALRAQKIMLEAAQIFKDPAQARSQQSAQRQQAADLLSSAYIDHLDSDYFLMEQAAKQYVIAWSLATGDRKEQLFNSAVKSIDRVVKDHQKLSSIAYATNLYLLKARGSKEQDDWQAAIDMGRWLTELDPKGIIAFKRLGDCLWESGDKAQAVIAYRQAIKAHYNFELDALKQLPVADFNELIDRIKLVENSKP
ncbi:MAG: O-antigen ligase family protein [Planctomycetes bacterium]|nr:O-antigen ligase family protein [Planctomycetota bacterium]